MSCLLMFLMSRCCCHGCFYTEDDLEIITELTNINDENLDTDPETDSTGTTGTDSSDERFLECHAVRDYT